MGTETDTKSGTKGRRYPVAALFKAYAAEKAGEEWQGEWGAALFYRPLAILAAPPLLRLGVPASAITLLSLLVALSLPLVALTAGLWATALVAVLVPILDCLDGTIARASGTASRRGHYLDFITGVIFRVTLYAAIGMLAEDAAPSWLQGLGLPLALLAALLAITARLCRDYAKQLAGGAPDGTQSGGGLSGWIYAVLSGLEPLLPLLLLAFGLAGRLGWLILWLLFYSALDFLHTQIAILRRLA